VEADAVIAALLCGVAITIATIPAGGCGRFAQSDFSRFRADSAGFLAAFSLRPPCLPA